ncbi:MAG: N-acetylmuramoyl-L-alanine amidase [Bacteroidota bacterium]|nr:N-acetylmuramoyl-L-alanine amidase [Bacteroidota bacterium]
MNGTMMLAHTHAGDGAAWAVRLAVCLLAMTVPLCTTSPQPTAVEGRCGETRFTIPALEVNGNLYVSVNALARSCGLRVYTDRNATKMEVITGAKRVKLTAGNPFVPIIDHATNVIERVVQLPLEVVKRDTQLYAPAGSFAPLLTAILERTVTFTESPRKPAGDTESGDPRKTLPDGDEQSGSGQGDSTTPPGGMPGISSRASAADITHADVDIRQNGTVLRIHTRKQVSEPAREESPDGTLILTFRNATIDVEEFRQTPLAGDDIRSISAVQAEHDARIEIACGEGIQARTVMRDGTSEDILVTFYRQASIESILSEEEQEKRRSSDKKKWALDCIVLDPGHGGRDPGAVGATGLKEKNVALGIALKVGELIKKRMKGVRVVFTRSDDMFIELYRRGKIANEAEGKLFISIHCNSTEKKPSTASGTEIYLLRPGRTEDAIRVAEFENSVIRLEQDYEKRYQPLTDENFILLTMAQSAFVKYAERFADLFDAEIRASKKLRSQGVKQAGFYVLVGASMPGVLIETGFLSNPKEEAFLASQAGQAHIASLIYQTIANFAVEYEKSLK